MAFSIADFATPPGPDVNYYKRTSAAYIGMAVAVSIQGNKSFFQPSGPTNINPYNIPPIKGLADALPGFDVPIETVRQYVIGQDIFDGTGAGRRFIASVSASGTAVLMFPDGTIASIVFPVGIFELAWAIRQVISFGGTGTFYRGN